MKRFLRWSGYTLLGLVLILMALVAGGYLWLRGGLPQTEGSVAVAGLEREVELLRDDDGLLTIRAESPRDAIHGLGFAHAQDRLAQMVLMRRLGEGRLSESLGKFTLRMDSVMRGLDLAGLAEASLAHLEPRTLELLEAYAEGVNAYMETHRGALPPEFYVLGIEPEPWHPRDSVLWGKLMALRLSGNWWSELRQARLAAALSEEELAALFPDLPVDSPTTLPDAGKLARAAQRSLLAALPPELIYRGASNVWAVSGERTPSGKPVLANDPHLPLEAPTTWYLARIETPEWTAAGATAPGAPAILIGHNTQIAWGFTTTHSDTQDLVIETLDPDRPDHYLTPSGPVPFETREVEIPVRFGEPETVTLRNSRFGPVISDLSEGAAAAASALGEDYVLALAWPALRPDDTTPDALVGLNFARSWDEFLIAMRRWVVPQQNIAYADITGRIGFLSPALVPIRIGYDGSRPVLGFEREEIWSGFIPFDELPRQVDPESGWIVNANNRVVGPDYPYLLTTAWPEPYRAQRIEDALLAESRHGVAEAKALQLDETSLMAQSLLPLMLREPSGPTREAEAMRLLSAWDGTMAADRPEPLIFSAWVQELTRGLFAKPLGPLWDEVAEWDAQRIAAALQDPQRWCAGDCQEVLDESLATALSLLGEEDLSNLRWGEHHKARLAHPLFGRIPLLRNLVDLNLSTGGDNYTVNRATPAFDNGGADFDNLHGPGMRVVFDLADLDASEFIISTGQSGNPLSPWYGNFAERWRDGSTVKLVAPSQEASRRLRLSPR